MSIFNVERDAVSVGLLGNVSTTLTVISGDTLYYADNSQVSAASHQGSLTSGNSATFTNNVWIVSASASSVSQSFTAASGGGAGVSQIIAGSGIGLAPSNGVGAVTVTSTGAVAGASGPGGTPGANTGATVTIGNPTGFNQWWGVMNAATVTVTMPTAVAGALFEARFDQDATGGRTLAFASNPTFPGYVSAAAALAKVNAQNAANAQVWLTFVCVDGSTWQAFPALPQGRAVVSITSGASITPALQGPQDHVFAVSALAAAMTVNAVTGSPVDGQKIEFRLAQNGTGGFAVTWNAAFTTANTPLITWPSEPTAASATWKELYEWNAGTSKWERLAMV